LAEFLDSQPVAGLWPVDRLVLGYYAIMTVAIAALWNRMPDAKKPGRASWIFRHWYVLLYVTWSFREMALLIPAVRTTEADAFLAQLDYRIWGANPTVWLERIASPGLTEFLQIVYTLFVPMVLMVAFWLWHKGRYAEFRYYAFLIGLGYLVSYLGYLLVPARGPRFFLHQLQTIDLRGLWFTGVLQATLDRLETKAWDCFPSGHTEITVLAWYGSRRISNRLFAVYFAYTLCIISATVYLRYHYTIDVLAGAAVAGLLVLLAPHLYRTLGKGAV